MHLNPKKYKNKKSFRLKKFKNYKNSSLVFGNCGFRILNNLVLSSKHVLKLIILVKKYTRKSDKTFRKFWINYQLSIPFTKKVKGSRMGKGKGKVFLWGFKLSSGRFLFELKNVRFGRFLHFFKLINFFLNSKNSFTILKKNTLKFVLL